MRNGADAESVLVVDDDWAIRKVLHEILSREGYQVRVAENGAQALDTMRTLAPDVVVLDLMMPVMSGWEVLAITDEDEALRSIPILVTSAMAAPVASAERRGGVRLCLSKPLDIPALLEALRWVTTPPSSVPLPQSIPPINQPTVESPRTRLRVLMVEDSSDDASLIGRELDRAGYDVQTTRVATESEYVAALDQQTWDVVLSDFRMPGFSGKAALDVLQARAVDVPFIMVSGTVGEDVAVQVMKAGAHDFFLKGNLPRLAAAVRREVREAERRRAALAERKRAASELEHLLCDLRSAVRVRDDFLSIASHELKTPLTSLQLEVQLLQRRLAREGPAGISNNLEAKLTVIERQVTRLTMLVDGLLDARSLATAQTALAREPVDLKEIVNDVLARSAEFLRQSGSELKIHTTSVVGSWDRARVESIVANIVLNAVKYGDGKPIEISLDADGATARLVVTDHGMGVPEEEQSHIFDKFARAVPIDHFGGLGLGLWVAKQSASMHGGDILCESKVGLGSTFTVHLPVRQEEARG